MHGKATTAAKGIYRTPSGRFEVRLTDGRGGIRFATTDTLAEALALKEANRQDNALWRAARREAKRQAARDAARPEIEARKAARSAAAAKRREARDAGKNDPDIVELIRLSRLPWYDADTGVIYRNGKRADRPRHGRERYRFIEMRVDGKRKKTPAHRFAVFYMTGSWPIGPVDHINGIGDDNRWVNLREVTVAENNANVAVPHSRKVVRVNGRYYPLLTRGFTCPHEATLIAEAMSGIFDL